MKVTKQSSLIQARIAQLVAYRLGTGEVPGSNPCKGENISVKISNWIGPAVVAWFVKASVFHSVNSNMYSALWH